MEDFTKGIQESQERFQTEFQDRVQRFEDRCDAILEDMDPLKEEEDAQGSMPNNQ